ncbi:MAG: hypothetical protein WB565_07240 [Acidimicrobiales bacterium]
MTPDEVDAAKKASAAPILEPTPNQSRKEVPKMGKKQAEKELRKALGLGDPSAPRRPSLTTALSMMKNAAEVAEAQGNVDKASGLRRERLEILLAAQERALAKSGAAEARYGPGRRPLFPSGTGTLPEDRSIGYR